MILPDKFRDQCSPTYLKAIDELELKLYNINIHAKFNISIKNVQTEIGQVILSFAKNYLTPKQYWEYWMKYFVKNTIFCEELKESCLKIAKVAYFHLYYNKEMNAVEYWNHGHGDFLQAYGEKCVKVIDFQNKHYLERGFFKEDYENYVVTEKDLRYPHDFLKECFHEFESEASCLPSKKLIKRYNEMLELYPRIKAAESGDIEKWFKLLLEVDDIDFVKDNVECRLGHDLLDIQLWKLYLAFLKEKKQYKTLLETYSKYCRFFLDDKEMLEEYKQEMIENGPIKLEWKNLFDFEMGNNFEDEKEKFLTVDTKLKLAFDKKIVGGFYNSIYAQIFSFRQTFIFYLLKNANHRILRKLFASCKYFFAKMQTPICYHLESSSLETIRNERLTLQSSSKPENFFKNTFLTGVIDIENLNPHKNNFMSSIIPFLYRCEAKHISLEKQTLTFNALKFLIQHGNVVDLRIDGCEIKDENDEYIALEDIIKYLPNVEILTLPNIKTTANTGHALAKQKFYGKLYDFFIQTIYGEPFDADEFLSFLKDNRDPEMLTCEFFFDPDFNADFVEKFQNVMKDFEDSNENCDILVDFNS
uniref:Uncharacterized protein n=1 Tax=Panagrolaimus davidi TaxID=227884 RepID=A0A914PRA2_9BILA